MDIEIEDLRKSYAGVAAVDGISLRVPEGQMLVLLGPSGCGKTTTMRCIAGLEQPDGGTVSIGGREVFSEARKINVPVNKRRVGMVFQSYAIWPHMTVAENVAYPLDMANVPRKEKAARVAEILSLVGLDGFADRGASYLSGGQMQRVALARSLVMRPAVLLFDEPLSNLDARLRDRLRVQLRELQTQLKITSVYVTHDQHEALALADQIAVMQAGRVVQLGDPVSVYRRPKTSRIADFVGYSNIFDASVIERDSGVTLLALEDGMMRLQAAESPPDTRAPLAVCVRPDDVVMHPLEGSGFDAAQPSVNRVAGEVILASFVGAFYQYRVKVAGGRIWEVLRPGMENPFRLGMRVVLEIPAAAILILAKD